MSSERRRAGASEHITNGRSRPRISQKFGTGVAALILLVAFGLRLYRLAFQSIWWDEGHSLFVASHKLSEIPTIPAMDVHPPLFFWLLHGWMGWAGASEFALRFLSLLFGVLTVALMYRVGRDLFGITGGWAAALLATFSPLYIAYSQEVRMYALITALSLSSVYLFYRYVRASFQKDERRTGQTHRPAGQTRTPIGQTRRSAPTVKWVVPYAVVTAAGLYSHYFVGFLLIFENLYWLGLMIVSGQWRKLRNWSRWIIGQAVIALLLAPQIYTATRQVTSYKNTNLIPPEFLEFLAGCWQAFTLGLSGEAGRVSLWMSLVLVVLVAGLLARYIPRPDRKFKTSELILWALAFAIPLLIYYLVLLDRASFSPRYMIVITPTLYMLLAYAVWQLGRRWVPLGVFGLVVLLSVFIVSDYRYFFDSTTYKDETRELARFLEEKTTAQDIIFIDVPHPLDYYYQGESPQQYLFVDIHTIADVLTEASQARDRLFFIRWRQSDTDPRGAALFLLDKYSAYRGEKQFRGYHVVWYDLPNPANFSLPAELEAAHLNFNNRLILTGAAYGGRGQGATSAGEEVRQHTVPAGRNAWVTLEWQVPQEACHNVGLDPSVYPKASCLHEDYKVALYLEDADGRRVGQVDKPLLNDRHLRTTGWTSGDVALNVYTLPVAPATPPGDYIIKAVVYRMADGKALPVLDNQGAPQGIAAPIGALRVVRPDEPPALSNLSIESLLDVPLGEDLVLLGYDLPQRHIETGKTLPLSLYWEAKTDITRDYLIRLALVDAQGDIQAEANQRPVNGTYPTTNWVSGEILRDRTDFLIPPSVSAGEYDLQAGLIPADTSEPVAEIFLGNIMVEGRAHQFEAPDIGKPLEMNFDDKIRLLGYDIQGFEAPNLKITFYWQALAEMNNNYKVFTHLLGKDGKMWGQKDDFPGAGTLPTTSWVKDEIITDLYEIPLDADAPAGPYTLELGFYDPVSGARLPVTGSSDNSVSDHILLPEIEISR